MKRSAQAGKGFGVMSIRYKSMLFLFDVLNDCQKSNINIFNKNSIK